MYYYGYSVNPVLLAAAVIPAVVLLVQVYKRDRLEKEPAGLLIKLVVLGALSTALASLTESIGMNLVNDKSLVGAFILYFIVVALSEEGFKFLILKIFTWKNPNFNCTFDAVVYAVFVSLGFALWENILYVMNYGLETALVRAITAVPAHASFGVLMGCFYGMAKRAQNNGNMASASLNLKLAVIMPVIAHGAYDFFASIGGGSAVVMFIGSVIVLFTIAFRLVRKLSADDTPFSSPDDSSYM